MFFEPVVPHPLSFLTLKRQLVTLQQGQLRQTLVISLSLDPNVIKYSKYFRRVEQLPALPFGQIHQAFPSKKIEWIEIQEQLHWCWLVVL